jgi:hypothetical protein
MLFPLLLCMNVYALLVTVSASRAVVMRLTARSCRSIALSVRCVDLERSHSMCRRHLPTVTSPPKNDSFITW